MATIAPYRYQAWFHVVTVHGSQLEFILDAADDRAGRPARWELQVQGRTFTSYTEALWNMFDAQFKSDKEVLVRERQEYGDVSFLLEAPTALALDRALAICEKTTQRWINKYRINHMKGT